MIKSNKGEIAISGDLMTVLAEFDCIVRGLLKSDVPARFVKTIVNESIERFERKQKSEDYETVINRTFVEALKKAMKEEHDD